MEKKSKKEKTDNNLADKVKKITVLSHSSTLNTSSYSILLFIFNDYIVNLFSADVF